MSQNGPYGWTRGWENVSLELRDKPLSALELSTATSRRSQSCTVRLIMMTRGILLITISVLALIGLASPNAAAAQDQLAAAKELYRAAAFDDALTSFELLAANIPSTTPQSREVARYRAFCLLALGRYRGAEQAIEGIILAEPTYIPSESEVSPRISSAFRDIRRRILPEIARDIYSVGRSAFDRKGSPPRRPSSSACWPWLKTRTWARQPVSLRPST